MAVATLEFPDGVIHQVPLVSRGGEVLISRDVGKTDLSIRKGGFLNPRFQDQYSGVQNLTISGQYTDSDAYSQAIEIADQIKSQYQSAISFTASGLDEFQPDGFESALDVVPAIGSETPLSITYEPGRRNWVEIQLSLSQVNSVRSNGSLGASTPTGTGNGPIELEGIPLDTDVTVERQVGRPQDSENRRPNSRSPIYVYKQQRAFDGFEIRYTNVDDPTTDVSQLYDLFSQPLGTTPLTLDFNGLYGLGSFNVVPQGSQSLRHIRVAGREGTIEVPAIALRRVRP
jgi:hypothetical protein